MIIMNNTNIENIHDFDLRMQGAMQMLEAIERQAYKFALDSPGGKNCKGNIYHDAILRLIKDRSQTEYFLEGFTIGYRNFENDAKGKIVRCEAYFVK